jgi:hypothetical protein
MIYHTAVRRKASMGDEDLHVRRNIILFISVLASTRTKMLEKLRLPPSFGNAQVANHLLKKFSIMSLSLDICYNTNNED